MKATQWKKIFTLLALLGLFLASCNTEEGNASSPSVPEEESSSQSSENMDEESQEQVEAEEEAEVAPSLPPLPAAIVEFSIVMDDGRELEARYYPGATNPSPTIVLMHWAGGALQDWDAIAPWLQNRGLQSSQLPKARTGLVAQATDSWLDPTWFPVMPSDASFAVVTFSFGGFGSSQGAAGFDSWNEEAYQAIQATSQLDGVDPSKIVSLGASIGADGAVDGCYLFNMDGDSGSCLGAFSLSPGNYLTNEFSYAEAVTYLDQLEYPVWCLAAEGDAPSEQTCKSTEGANYLPIAFAGIDHGMMLLQSDLFPAEPPLGVNALVIVQDFLELVFDQALN